MGELFVLHRGLSKAGLGFIVVKNSKTAGTPERRKICSCKSGWSKLDYFTPRDKQRRSWLWLWPLASLSFHRDTSVFCSLFRAITPFLCIMNAACRDKCLTPHPAGWMWIRSSSGGLLWLKAAGGPWRGHSTAGLGEAGTPPRCLARIELLPLIHPCVYLRLPWLPAWLSVTCIFCWSVRTCSIFLLWNAACMSDIILAGRNVNSSATSGQLSVPELTAQRISLFEVVHC